MSRRILKSDIKEFSYISHQTVFVQKKKAIDFCAGNFRSQSSELFIISCSLLSIKETSNAAVKFDPKTHSVNQARIQTTATFALANLENICLWKIGETLWRIGEIFDKIGKPGNFEDVHFFSCIRAWLTQAVEAFSC